MERREFLKALGAAGGLAALPHGEALSAQGSGAATQSGEAYSRLLATLEEANRRYLSKEFAIERLSDIADGHRFLMHALQSGLVLHLESDPRRPRFNRIVSPTLKLLGDQPDAMYFGATLDPAGRYRIRGNMAGAVYSSFTIEDGTREGHYPTSTSSTLNSDQFKVDADGNFEVLLSADEQPGDWMKLVPEAGTITTRHYFEDEVSVAKQPNKLVPLTIERLDDVPPPPSPDDASIAAAIDRVSNYVKGVSFGQARPQDRKLPAWISLTPNQFNAPAKPGDIGFAAVDNAYAMAPYVIQPGQALVIEGRFPRCRFASVVLWNRYLQSYDYANRTVSLNRKQTVLRPDGSFAMVLAAEDPGVPNWIDTEGRISGSVYWRFLLPEGHIETPRGRVVEIASLKS